MKLLGLNSPEIFIILVVLLSILGPKRIEKGFLLFKGFLKFLLRQEDNMNSGNLELKE
ncbi:cell surface protein, partial [Prochlorococcus marinus str. MU1415]|nr:cell surface protein [Prochlorococcus marinus str. MU1415]